MSPPSDSFTVVCYARPSLLLDPIDSHVETLRTCEREGRIETLLVRSWPAQLPCSGETTDREGLEAFERFGDWADRAGVSIEPPFDVRTRSSAITGESREIVVTPLLCLALYDGNTLVGVYPHDDGGRTRDVSTTVAALRTGQLQTAVVESSVDRSVDSCPDCDERVVNGQGLCVCIDDDCYWVGVWTEAGWYRDHDAAERPVTADALPGGGRT